MEAPTETATETAAEAATEQRQQNNGNNICVFAVYSIQSNWGLGYIANSPNLSVPILICFPGPVADI
jgi:hypothetical protein